mgnify:CR=1 FL=1
MHKFDNLVPGYIEGKDRAIALALLEEYHWDEDKFGTAINGGEDANAIPLTENLKLLWCETDYDDSSLETACKISFSDYYYMEFSEWWETLPERWQSMLDAGCNAREIEMKAEILMTDNVCRIVSEIKRSL